MKLDRTLNIRGKRCASNQNVEVSALTADSWAGRKVYGSVPNTNQYLGVDLICRILVLFKTVLLVNVVTIKFVGASSCTVMLLRPKRESDVKVYAIETRCFWSICRAHE